MDVQKSVFFTLVVFYRQETDYGTNFANVDGGNWSTWSDSGLGQAFRTAQANPETWRAERVDGGETWELTVVP